MKKIKVLIIAIMFLFSLLSAVNTVSAVDYHVYSGGSIQDAIDAASSGDTIYVHAGTYYENIELEDGVALIGDGASVTTIDGGGSGTVVTATGVGSTTVLSGFKITNGSVTISDGGGMYNDNSSPTITNCTFSGNEADGHGGGMYNNNYSSPTLTNCTFTGNEAYEDGGGMYNDNDSSTTLTNCTFSSNTAYDDGGGMYNDDDSSTTLTNCTFTGNEAFDEGGGMRNDDDSSTTLTNCTFTGNTAIYEGGGMRNYESSPTLTNCIFSGNSAYNGGGMYNGDSSPTLTNCIFSDNLAYTGGGMYNAAMSSPTLTNCTFTGNSANAGGGMFNDYSSPIVTNCILWGDLSNEFYDYYSSPNVTYSDVEGGYIGTGNIDADPLFVDAATGDVHLQKGSPCIDTGTDAGVYTDMEGDIRPLRGGFDMGVDEVRSAGVSVMTFKPLMNYHLIQANTIWSCIAENLPEEIPEDVQEMIGQAQEHMANAASLSNPIYSNGELVKAIKLMENISEALGCECV